MPRVIWVNSAMRAQASNALRRSLFELFFNEFAVCVEFAFLFVLFVLIDSLQAAVPVGFEAVGSGAASATYQLSNAGNNLAVMMQGKDVHAYHDVGLRMIVSFALDTAVADRCKHRGMSWTAQGVLAVALFAAKQKQKMHTTI